MVGDPYMSRVTFPVTLMAENRLRPRASSTRGRHQS
jgi:hypothetical protein